MTDTFSFHPPALPSDHYHPHIENTIYGRQRPSSSSGSGFPQHPSPQNSYQMSAPPGTVAGRPPYDGAGPATSNQRGAENESGGSDSDDYPLIGLPASAVTSAETVGIPTHLKTTFEGGPPNSMASYAPSPLSFPSQYHVGAGVNMHNTRPMTAPSSVSAPYFHGSGYTPSAFFPPSHFEPVPHRPFQFQVDNNTDDDLASSDPYRARQFSLPELNGVPGSDNLADPSGGSPGSSTFYYRPPSDSSSYYRPNNNPSSPDQGDVYSRPTTADSRTTSSSRMTVRHPGQAPARNGPTASYQALANPVPFANADDERPNHYGEAKVYNFIAQAGQTTKRPRRRYDEIERLYTCDYPGCQKAYGTLNHLNSHKTMQKHGPKSTPAQFKELRKAWRENKKAAQAAAAARAQENELKAGGPLSKLHNKGAPIRPIAERPRPSTSAGEYHYNVPAPFMSSVGTPIGAGAPYPPVHLPLPTPLNPFEYSQPPSGAPVSNWPPAGYHRSNPAAFDSAYQSSSPHRPLTAPSYYSGVPNFGYQGGPSMQGPGAAFAARRSSLPGGPPAFGYDKSFPSIQEEGGFHPGEQEHAEEA